MKGRSRINGNSRTLLAILFLLAFSLVIAACSGKTTHPVTAPIPVAPQPSNTPSSPTAAPTPAQATSSNPSLSPAASAATIEENAAQALASVKSYRLNRTISSLKSAKSDRSDEVRTLIVSNMALDISGRRMQMGNKINTRVPPGQPNYPLVENSLYIIGDMMYIQGLFPDEPQTWTKTTITESYWQIQNQARQIVELMQLSQAATLAPASLVSGNLTIPCDVLQVTPDLPKLWAIMAGQPGMQLPAGAPPGFTFEQLVKKAEMKLWVARSGGVPVKATLQMDFGVGPAQVPALTSEVSQEISLEMLFSDYDQIKAIELPPEAKNAPDLNLQKSP